MVSAIPQLKTEDELACLVNIILPKRLRPQMLTNTAAFQFRKQQTQDQTSSRRHGTKNLKNDATSKEAVRSAKHT